MLAQKIKTEGELSDKAKKLDEANAALVRLNDSLRKLKQDSINLDQGLQINTKKLADLNREYEKLNTNYKTSLNKSGKLSQDLALQRDQLLAIQDNLERTRKQNDSLGNSKRGPENDQSENH